MNFNKQQPSTNGACDSLDQHIGYEALGTVDAPSAAKPRSRTLKKGMKQLPDDFTPSQYSVFCGRGKGYYQSVGNRRLRVTVNSFLPRYIEAEGIPTERSRIISQVKDMVKHLCPVGAFIKYENGHYYELSDKAAREKVSAMFRDTVVAWTKQARSNTKKDSNDTVPVANGKQARAAIRRNSSCTSMETEPQLEMITSSSMQARSAIRRGSLCMAMDQLEMTQSAIRRGSSCMETEQLETTTSSTVAACAADNSFPVVPPVAAARQTSMGDDSSASCNSIGSFYDVDTNQAVSIHDNNHDDHEHDDRNNNEIKLDGLSEFLQNNS